MHVLIGGQKHQLPLRFHVSHPLNIPCKYSMDPWAQYGYSLYNEYPPVPIGQAILCIMRARCILQRPPRLRNPEPGPPVGSAITVRHPVQIGGAGARRPERPGPPVRFPDPFHPLEPLEGGARGGSAAGGRSTRRTTLWTQYHDPRVKHDSKWEPKRCLVERQHL